MSFVLLRRIGWLALGLLAAAGAAAAPCEKTVRWNEDPPFSMRRADGEIVGLNVELVRETLRRMDCSARLVEMPWARALTELEAGRLDILPGALRSPERERFALFSAPGPQSRNILFMHQRGTATWRFGKLADLRGSGFRLGTQIGVSYGPAYDALMRDPGFASQVQKVATRRSLWLMAEAGRIDGVLADELTGRMELAQLGLQDKIKSTSLVVAHEAAAVAFSRKSMTSDFVERYNKVSEVMLQDGTIAAIWQRYAAP